MDTKNHEGRKYLAKVRFVNKKNGQLKLGEKTYDYYISSDVIHRSANSNVQIEFNQIPLYNIVNDNGYDYRKSLVYIEEIFPIPKDEVKSCILNIIDLKRIVSVRREEFQEKDLLKQELETEKLPPFIKKKDNKLSDPIYKLNNSINELSNSINEFKLNINSVNTSVSKEYKEKEIIKTKYKENNKMKNFTNKFNFGPASSVKMSIYGPAFGNIDNGYISYDKATNRWVDVEDFIFDVDRCCYLMPVAAKDVKVNDYIIHNGSYVRIMKVGADGVLEVEKLGTNEIITIFPVKNMFGFDFYTKLFCLMEGFIGEASNEHPFGNPMMLMALMNNQDKNSFKDILPFMMMSNMVNNNKEDTEVTENTNIFSNPMMLYFLMKD